MRRSVRRTRLLALCCLWIWAAASVGAHDAPECPGLASSVGGLVEPAPCVAAGTRFALRVTAYVPGQLRSLVVRGPSGLVSGADRALRMDAAGRLELDSADYVGTPLAPGLYTAWVKDPSGGYAPAQLVFRVSGVPRILCPLRRRRTRSRATPLPPTPTTAGAATRRPTATTDPAPAPPAASAAPSALPPSAAATSAPTATGPPPAPTPPTATPTIAASVPSAAPTAARSGERVQIVVVDPDVPDDEGILEYVMLQNLTSAPLAMDGGSLGDTTGQRVALPAFTIEREAYLMIWTGAGVADEEHMYLGRRTAL